ncbi:hypothetical protein CAEBREN_07399 [Caenorhabditis brenneri]|uniref:Uncharacterized protein n=1 Tax=Caenorhabditis brenneri TaxID=135651 RepID=G0MZX1_CAEBE|nr:hypothetical protein CAEBREN_07399 [Caenorhabditis brenneri]
MYPNLLPLYDIYSLKHAWCGARLLLWTNKLVVFKIVFGISVYTTLAVGVGIPVVTVVVGHFSLFLYSFAIPAAIILADMTYVLYKITFKPNRKLVSSKLGLHLLELRKEKDHKEGKMWRGLEEVSAASTASKASNASKMSKVSKESKKSKGSEDSKASLISKCSKTSNNSKISTVSKDSKGSKTSNNSKLSTVSTDSKGSKNSKMSAATSISKSTDSKISGK